MFSNQKKWTILICSFAVVLIAASALWLLNVQRDTNQDDTVSSTVEPTEVARPEETPAPVTSKPIIVQLDTVQPQTLWQSQDYKIYVEQLRLYSQAAQSDPKLLFEWDEAHPAQAWVNGEYVLVGVQLQERADEDNFVEQGSVGSWIVAKGGEQAALLHDSERSFCPQLGPKDLLRMAIVAELSFFMTTFKVSDADRWISYVFNPARSEWSTVERGREQPRQLLFATS